MACKQCGMCCRVLPVPVFHLQLGKCKSPECDTCKNEHKLWKRITREEAMSLNPHMVKNVEDSPMLRNIMVFHTCTALTDEGLCPFHGDDKLETCAGWPWYGKPIPGDGFKFPSPDCGFIPEWEAANAEFRNVVDAALGDKFKRVTTEGTDIKIEVMLKCDTKIEGTIIV